MERKNKIEIVSKNKSRYILPSMLTLFGVCLGISSIKFAMDGNFSYAVLFLVVAAILDGLDGRVARLIKGTSDFGKELDSLTDVISFGVAPAFIMYFWALSEIGRLGWLISLIYVVCVALRLARFNVSSEEESSWRDNFFEGIPSPAGGILVLMPLVLSFSEFKYLNENYKLVVPIFFIIISILLISKIPTYSLKKIAVPRSTSIFLLFSIILYFGLILVYTFNTIIISGIIYLLMIPVSAFHFYKIKKNSKINSEEIEHHEDVL